MKLTVTILALALGSFSCAGYGYGYGNGYGYGAHEVLLHTAEVSQLQRDSALAENSSLSASLAIMQNDRLAGAYELQRLRERVNYGRRFRLLGQSDCAHGALDCDFGRVHSGWRAGLPSSLYSHSDASCRICSLSN